MITRVKIADVATQKESGVLVTVGLGSCVGIVFYDKKNKVAGMAHVLLPDSSQFNSNKKSPMKFADTALPLMLEEMLKKGALKKNIVAKIAGGSKLFDFDTSGGQSGLGVGGKNVLAVKKTLKAMGISLSGEDVGGSFGRSMKLFVDTGLVEVSSLEGYKKTL